MDRTVMVIAKIRAMVVHGMHTCGKNEKQKQRQESDSPATIEEDSFEYVVQ